METEDRLTEDQARIALARAGIGGGYVATRITGGWLFTPAFPPVFGNDRGAGHTPWLVADTGQTVRYETGRSIADMLDGLTGDTKGSK